ncbi:MAG: hypothetical protein IPM96_17615 [Ignavibacteria bacterium]|nr:hypothetical protein [Ignavibacteria bacterium]
MIKILRRPETKITSYEEVFPETASDKTCFLVNPIALQFLPLFAEKNTASSKEIPPTKRFVPETASAPIYGNDSPLFISVQLFPLFVDKNTWPSNISSVPQRRFVPETASALIY